jgi:hypothetical protein
VGCGTPTASANYDALTAWGTTKGFTTRVLRAALYPGIPISMMYPTPFIMTNADARVIQQLS